MNDDPGHQDAIPRGDDWDSGDLSSARDDIPPSSMGFGAVEYEDGGPEREPAELPPPSPPPLRLDSQPGMVNVAAVCSEGWTSDVPKQRDHAAYYAGRLWNAIRWLQALTIFFPNWRRSLHLEIECLGTRFKQASLLLMTPKMYESQGRERCEELINWRLSNRDVEYLEGLWTDEFGNESLEPDPAKLEPDDRQCFQLLGITRQRDDSRLVTAIELGIVVDTAIRPWRNGDTVSARFRNPWVSETTAITDATFATQVDILTGRLTDFKTELIPTNLSYFTFQEIERGIRAQFARLDLPKGDEEGILDLVLNRENKTIRRNNWKHNQPVVLGNWYEIVRELATTDRVVLHERLQTLYREAFRVTSQ